MTEVKPLRDEEVTEAIRDKGGAFSFAKWSLATITALKSENADLKEAKNTAREIVARWMIDNSFATGHGDSIYDLLQSLESQVCEIRSENEKLTDRITVLEGALEIQGGELSRAFDEHEKLRNELIPFIAVHAVSHARDGGLDGLHPQFYDRLKELGARMDDFKRAALAKETK